MIKLKRFHILCLICFSTLYIPFFELSSSAPSLRLEWFFLILGILVFPIRKISTSTSLWYFALILSMIISILYGIIFLGVRLGKSDMFELLKPILYFLFFSFAKSVAIDPKMLKIFLRFNIILFLSLSLIAIIQYFGGGPLFKLFFSLYTPEERVATYVGSRATATMSNPNDLGMALTIGFALSVFSLDIKLPFRISFYAPFILLFGIIASGSRTALISTIIITLVFIRMQFKLGRVTFKSLFFLIYVLAFIVVFVIFNADLFTTTAYRLFLSSDDSAISSLTSRVTTTLEVLGLISDSPILGWGVNKIGFASGDNIDNEYILFLYRYGIVGLLIILGVFWNMRNGTKSKFIQFQSPAYFYNLFLSSLLIGASVFAYAAGIFHTFRLCTLIVIFLGVGAGLINDEDSSTNYSIK
jgi:O-antigen ligase